MEYDSQYDPPEMPIHRFRTIAEMSQPRWYEPGDPRLYEAIRRLWSLGHRTTRPRFPPGVYKHRGIAEMNALQEEWAQANFDAYHERRAKELARLEGVE